MLRFERARVPPGCTEIPLSWMYAAANGASGSGAPAKEAFDNVRLLKYNALPGCSTSGSLGKSCSVAAPRPATDTFPDMDESEVSCMPPLRSHTTLCNPLLQLETFDRSVSSVNSW